MINAMPADAPATGDIIVRRMDKRSRRFTLGTVGEAAQIVCASYEDAVTRAEQFAERHQVDVWQTSDGRVFRRLIEHRFVEVKSGSD